MQHETRKCPVCGAVCFADIDVCYGCLHRFEGPEEEDLPPAAVIAEEVAGETEGNDTGMKLFSQDGQEFEIVINVRPVTAHATVRGKHSRDVLFA